MDSNYESHDCKQSHICFSRGCRFSICEDCIDLHSDHYQYIVDKSLLIKQLLQIKNKYYKFTDKIIDDMKTTLMLAARQFQFNISYINSLIQLLISAEDAPNQEMKNKRQEEIEGVLLKLYTPRTTPTELILENINLKHFLEPIKSSFSTLSSNYLDFYKRMRNMELLKIVMKVNTQIAKQHQFRKGIYTNKRLAEKMQQIYCDIQKGYKMKDLSHKYKISEITASKYIKETNKGDQDLKTFLNQPEYKELMALLEEDEQLQKQQQQQQLKQVQLSQDDDNDNNNNNNSQNNQSSKKLKKQNDKHSERLGSYTQQCDSPPQTKRNNRNQNSSESNANSSNSDKKIKRDSDRSSGLKLIDNNGYSVTDVDDSELPKTNQTIIQKKKITPPPIPPLPPSIADACLKFNPDEIEKSQHLFSIENKYIGVAYRDEVKIFQFAKSINQTALTSFKITHSKIYKDNFIQSIKVVWLELNSNFSSNPSNLNIMKLRKSAIFSHSYESTLFYVNTQLLLTPLLNSSEGGTTPLPVISGVDVWDCICINQSYWIYCKQKDKVNLHVISFNNENVIEKKKKPITLVELNATHLDFSLILAFITEKKKNFALLCTQGIAIFKEDKEEKYFKTKFFDFENISFMRTSSPFHDQYINIIHSTSQDQVIQYNSKYNQFKNESQLLLEPIKDFQVLKNASSTDCEASIVVYSNMFSVIKNNKRLDFKIEVGSPLKRITGYLNNNSIKIAYQTDQDTSFQYHLIELCV